MRRDGRGNRHGGRLDCTNIVNPLVSVITLIELEHTAFLGNTVAAVAGEKAGIIKSGKPLVLARQGAEALEVFRKQAAEKTARCFTFPISRRLKIRAYTRTGPIFPWSCTGKTPRVTGDCRSIFPFPYRARYRRKTPVSR
uniref:Dihydrofolate synthase / Folylpolyglutamate synthase n=1 Tax=uncultured bacterium contig00063 TaxID=1181546 RepID=A0A806KCM1_9BACT|nr:dihydrofolate synthase / Folylpolyglutamate synthase [uncultured bacterium contig00063]